MSIRINKEVLDKLGILASVACAVHCAVLPLVITVLPLIGMEFLANEWVEISMICLAIGIGAWSLVGAYSSHKKSCSFNDFVARLCTYRYRPFLDRRLRADSDTTRRANYRSCALCQLEIVSP